MCIRDRGIRGEVGQMYAIATIKEDFLGYVDFENARILLRHLLTVVEVPCSRLESCCYQEARQYSYENSRTHKNRAIYNARRREEHTRLKFITSQKSSQRRCAKIILCEQRLCSVHSRPMSGTREESTIDGGKRGKKQNTPLISSFEIETPPPKPPFFQN